MAGQWLENKQKGRIHMTRREKVFDANGDLLVQRYKQGVTLVKPTSCDDSFNNRISSIYNLPITAYFLDADSRIVNSNDATAELVGASSFRDMLGKSVESFAKRSSVEKVLATDKEIVLTKKMKVTEETGDISNSVTIQALSFKFPWYYEDAVIGIFGCSIKMNGLVIGELANAFYQLIATGLLSFTQSLPLSLTTNYQNQFSQFTEREKQVLTLLIRGKTAKEIGNRLGISRRTVEHHIESLKFKTNSKFKSDLIDKFIE